jgi:hypothetical protein
VSGSGCLPLSPNICSSQQERDESCERERAGSLLRDPPLRVRRPLPIRRHGWRLLAAEEIGVLTVGWQWRVLSCVTNSNGLLGCQWTCLAGPFWFSPGSCDMPRQHVLRVPVLVDPVSGKGG